MIDVRLRAERQTAESEFSMPIFDVAAAADDNQESEEQKPLRIEAFELTTSLRFIAKQTRALWKATLDEIDVEGGQDEFIHALPDEGAMTVSAIAAVIRVRPATVSKMADRLVRAGLIHRTVDPADGRKIHIGLTRDGVAKKARIEGLMADLEKDLIAEFSDNGDDAISMLTRIDEAVFMKLKRLR